MKDQPENKTKAALSYIPVLLAQLDNDGREMFGVIMQAMLDIGYEHGWNDFGNTPEEIRGDKQP